jgi:hypothetical protein
VLLHEHLACSFEERGEGCAVLASSFSDINIDLLPSHTIYDKRGKNTSIFFGSEITPDTNLGQLVTGTKVFVQLFLE